MRKFLVFLIAIVLWNCNQNFQSTPEILIVVDQQFSKMSVDSGFKQAFYQFAHSEAVLLRENSMPVKGKSSIRDLFAKANEKGVHFSWKPLHADIARSGELGYTYGIFTIKTDSISQQGTYVSIWKKDENNVWKYILDSGNQGLGEQK